VRLAYASLLASLVMGVFFGESCYPFMAYLFPWSFSLQLQLLFPLVGSVVGVYLGNHVYSALSSVVLGGFTAFLWVRVLPFFSYEDPGGNV